MEKGNTKEMIMNAALEMFSIKGFEATSVAQIANAVGVQKASIYSHFSSKQNILDSLAEKIFEMYNQQSIFASANTERIMKEFNESFSEKKIVAMIKSQIGYIIHDPYVCRARKMLVIEQFQNPSLAELQHKQSYNDSMKFFTQLVEILIKKDVLINENSEIMAAQLCLPISVWINVCDRHPEKEQEVMSLVERHIEQFFRMYGGRDNGKSGDEQEA